MTARANPFEPVLAMSWWTRRSIAGGLGRAPCENPGSRAKSGKKAARHGLVVFRLAPRQNISFLHLLFIQEVIHGFGQKSFNLFNQCRPKSVAFESARIANP